MPRNTIIPAITLALVVAIAALAATPAGAQFVTQYLARTFTSSAPSGVNGFACKTNGCRVDLGTGANDYLFGNGTSVQVGGALGALGDIVAQNNITGGPSYSVTGGAFGPAIKVRWTVALALPTCTAADESSIYRMASTGGTGTLTRTRMCLCTSDGAASPVYAWQNLATGTVGNATTCNP